MKTAKRTAHPTLAPTHPTDVAMAEPTHLRHRGLRWFLAIAFLGAWIPWLGIYLTGGSLDNPLTQLAAAAFVPAIAALIVRLWITRQGLADSGLRANLRRSWRHYLVAVCLPWLILLTAVSVALLVGWAPVQLNLSISTMLYLAAGPLICLAMAPAFWGEEYGWTAYLRDRLVPGRPVAATFLTGFIWGVWHFPLPWVGYFGGQTAVAQAVWAMLLWIPLSILLEFIIGWLWSETTSVWPGAMLHAGANLVVAQGLSLTLGDTVGPERITLLLCAGLTPIVLAIIASGHTAGRRRDHRRHV